MVRQGRARGSDRKDLSNGSHEQYNAKHNQHENPRNQNRLHIDNQVSWTATWFKASVQGECNDNNGEGKQNLTEPGQNNTERGRLEICKEKNARLGRNLSAIVRGTGMGRIDASRRMENHGKCQSKILLRAAMEHKTVSTDALYVFTSSPPIKLIAEERKEVYDARLTNINIKAIVENEKTNFLESW